MKRLILFLIIIGSGKVIFAQKLGYIQNDSAYYSGYIHTQSETSSSKTCRYSQEAKSGIVTYNPDQILSYGYGKTDYISLKSISGNDTVNKFFEAIVQGDHPVYYLNETSGKQFYILGDKKELVELVNKSREYKYQLAKYFDAPTEIVPGIHTRFNRRGIQKTIKILKLAGWETVYGVSEKVDPTQKSLSIKQKRWLRMKKPVAIVSLQSGYTFQRLPLNLKTGLPSAWDVLKATSMTYSMAIDISIIKYWPVTYHQEICFNKFVSDYKQGSMPPDFQLIQNSSIISLPAMLRYTLGRNKFTGFINAGLQIDVVLNKNNVGWLIVGSEDKISGAVPVTTDYLDYKTFLPGITGGFGINFKLNKKLALTSEFRYSSVFSVLEGKAGTERLSVLKAGITYNIFKKQK